MNEQKSFGLGNGEVSDGHNHAMCGEIKLVSKKLSIASNIKRDGKLPVYSSLRSNKSWKVS